MRTIVVGCGRVGAGLSRALSLHGVDVAVVEIDPAAFSRLGAGFTGRTVTGTAMEHRVLVAAGIEDADGLAAVTGSDEVNAVIARLASRHFHVPRVMARLYDPRTAEVYRRLGIVTISPVAWGIQRLSDLLLGAESLPEASLGTGEVEVVAVEVPALLADRRASELEVPGELQVVALTRSGATGLAGAGSVLATGDIAHVAVAHGSQRRLDTLLGRV